MAFTATLLYLKTATEIHATGNIETVFGQAHTAKYCVAIRRDANVAAGVVEEDNLH
jgi:hypothetical protein